MSNDYTTETVAIRLSIPLLTRLLEYAREESPSDVDLHLVLERIIDNNQLGETLTMDHYTKLVPTDEYDRKSVSV